MEELPWVSAEKLKAVLHGLVDEVAEEIMQTMNAARPGHLIDDTEERVRHVGREFIRAAFEAAVQQKIDAAEASFSPSRDDRDRSRDSGPRDEAAAQQGSPATAGADGQRPRESGPPLVARSPAC